MGRIKCIAVLLILAVAAEARIINVPQDYATIQAGIDVSLNGDTVLVAPGTYHERINFNLHNITVGSLFLTSGDTAYIGNTVIDGDSLGTVVTFESGEDTTAVICGFTITGGNGMPHGGGVLCINGSRPLITHNIIVGNTALQDTWVGGGGIFCGSADPTISYNVIIRNVAHRGAGLECDHASPRIISNLITSNSCYMDGGGIHCSHAHPLIIGCTISQNRGGGVYYNTGSLTIKNSIIWGNVFGEIYGNSSDSQHVSYCAIMGGYEGIGNIALNPLFIDAAHDNYNICSLSPCVDGGDPDILDPNDTRSDIGYFYPVHTACPNGDVWNVSTTGDDSLGDGSAQSPFLTIQHAIDNALQGDTVIVLPGFYRESIKLTLENLVIASTWVYSGNWRDISNTIIDGGRREQAAIMGGCDSTSALIGFTIQNGVGRNGGGIAIENGDTRIEHNRVTRNRAIMGGGMYLYRSSSRILNNIIEFDSTMLEGARGGGLLILDSDLLVKGNTFYRNFAAVSGGGIELDPINQGQIINNVIVQNSTAGVGGGITCWASPMSISFNVIAGNRADVHGGGLYTSSFSPTLLGNIIWGNVSSSGMEQIYYTQSESPEISYCNIQGGWPGEGNIDENPRFRSLTNVDYHLQSHACGNVYDSPCIDAGPPDIFDGELGCWAGLGTGRSDMGAFGGGENVTGIEDGSPDLIPTTFVLFPNYPNPFNAQTTIRYALDAAADVTITIYDILGRRVQILDQGFRSAGEHLVAWDADGRPSGLYFSRLTVGDRSETGRMVLLK